MPTAPRAGIFIAYHFPEKRWLDRVQAAIEPVACGAPIVVWDDRKLLGGCAWRGELADVLARSKVAMMIVSDPFLLSGFTQRAKLPALLDKERERGLRICWVLASYCLFSVAGLRAEEAGHGINAALDGLSGVARDAQIAEVAQKVAALLAAPETRVVEEPAPAEPVAEAPAAEEAKPRAKRKRSKKAEPQILLPLAAEPEATPLLAPPPPQPHLEFPAPKPQTHLEPVAETINPVVESAPDIPREPALESATARAAEPETAPDPPPAAKPAAALAPAPGVPPILSIPPPKSAGLTALAAGATATPQPPTEPEPPVRRAESPMLPALDSVIDARQESIGAFRRLARWLKLSALGLAALSLPAALWVGLTHFLLIFGFALFIASLALFLHARIALLGQQLVGLRYTRSGLADELLPNRQREPLLRRAAEFVG
jgi:hypothetical protein